MPAHFAVANCERILCLVAAGMGTRTIVLANQVEFRAGDWNFDRFELGKMCCAEWPIPEVVNASGVRVDDFPRAVAARDHVADGHGGSSCCFCCGGAQEQLQAQQAHYCVLLGWCAGCCSKNLQPKAPDARMPGK